MQVQVQAQVQEQVQVQVQEQVQDLCDFGLPEGEVEREVGGRHRQHKDPENHRNLLVDIFLLQGSS